MPPKKSYDVWLPVYKQGDDYGQHLAETQNPSEAFLELANRYRAAADQCHKVGEALAGLTDVEAFGDTHSVGFSTAGDVQSLLDGGYIGRDTFVEDMEADFGDDDFTEGEQ